MRRLLAPALFAASLAFTAPAHGVQPVDGVPVTLELNEAGHEIVLWTRTNSEGVARIRLRRSGEYTLYLDPGFRGQAEIRLHAGQMNVGRPVRVTGDAVERVPVVSFTGEEGAVVEIHIER